MLPAVGALLRRPFDLARDGVVETQVNFVDLDLHGTWKTFRPTHSPARARVIGKDNGESFGVD